jgi:hypothetical protein
VATRQHKSVFNAYILSHFATKAKNLSGDSIALALDDPENCLESFARLLSGYPVRFEATHWSLYSTIARELRILSLPQWFYAHPINFGSFACQINANSVMSLFRNDPKRLTIQTRSQPYSVNYFGALFSTVLAALPLGDRIVLDVDDRYFSDFVKVLNFGEVRVTQENFLYLLELAKNLGMLDLPDYISESVRSPIETDEGDYEYMEEEESIEAIETPDKQHEGMQGGFPVPLPAEAAELAAGGAGYAGRGMAGSPVGPTGESMAILPGSDQN